jgi:hypothetical protein
MGNIAHRLKPPLENWAVDYRPSVSFRLFFCPIPFKLLGLCGNPSDPLVRFSEQSRKTLEDMCELWKEPVHLKTFNSQRETTVLTYTASGMQIRKWHASRLSRIDRGRS